MKLLTKYSHLKNIIEMISIQKAEVYKSCDSLEEYQEIMNLTDNKVLELISRSFKIENIALSNKEYLQYLQYLNLQKIEIEKVTKHEL